MTFDPCKQQFNLLLVRVGEYFNPKEKNITILAGEAAQRFGFMPYPLTTQDATHLPSPLETGPFFECPSCKEKSLVLKGLCDTCTESEGGKYKTMLHCTKCPHIEKSTKWIVQVLTDLGYDFSLQTKDSLGIKIIKDAGK